jgi:translation initiation factor IF-3
LEVLHIAKANGNQLVNDNIKFSKVRLIDAEGNMVGVVPVEDARKAAEEADLDLVCISANPDNPVCRIMDYGKFLFEQQKREKEQRKNQKVIEIKEIRMSSTIDTHDFETKVNQAIKFLKGGDKLKVSVRFRKRTVAHPQFGEELLVKFKEAVSEVGVVDKPSKMEGRSLVMFVAPKAGK